MKRGSAILKGGFLNTKDTTVTKEKVCKTLRSHFMFFLVELFPVERESREIYEEILA